VDDVLNRAEKEGVEAVAADLEKLHDAMDVENVSETNAAQVCICSSDLITVMMVMILTTNTKNPKWDEKTEADDGQTQFQSQSAEGAMPPAETTAPSGSVPGALLGQGKDNEARIIIIIPACE
jgi:hypothetical protein